MDTSKTSINQVPSLFRKILWQPNTVNFDNGGGKYKKGSLFLKGKKVKNIVYDPHNQSATKNNAALNQVFSMPADTSTIANVLNVIRTKEERVNVLRLSKAAAKVTYISIFEGDKSGIGSPTIKGWQNNKKTAFYLKEVKSVFTNVSFISLTNNIIIAR